MKSDTLKEKSKGRVSRIVQLLTTLSKTGTAVNFEVLSPAVLRKNVAQIARKMAEINNNIRQPRISKSRRLWETER